VELKLTIKSKSSKKASMNKKNLPFMQEHELHPELLVCPNCGEKERIGVNQRQKRQLICHACKKTFSETKGTP
jgi:transposase-like protein